MELQVGVKVALRNKEGKYLLLQRSSEKYLEVHKFGDIWDIVGGRIDPGTTLLDNLKREVREEVGLSLIEEPKLIAAQDILRIPGRHVVRLTYTANIEGEPRLDSDHVGYKWFTIEELKNLKEMDVYFREVLEKGILDPVSSTG
ncbi:MAG: NUDIX hydrolase [bacterium]|nr:NUDIX hydrolase [bacterium]